MTRMELPVIILTDDGPMADGSSPELLDQLLRHFEENLLEMGVPLDRWLAPGLPPSVIRKSLREVGLVASDELIVWFGWHDGVVMDLPLIETVSALPNFRQAKLEHAIQRYRDLVLDFEPPYGTDVPWEDFMFGAGEGWLRLADSNRGCAIDCFGEFDRSRPPRIRSATEMFLEPGAERLHRAVSLCTLVTWWLEGLRVGEYSWDHERREWIIDFNREPASRLNAHFN